MEERWDHVWNHKQKAGLFKGWESQVMVSWIVLAASQNCHFLLQGMIATSTGNHGSVIGFKTQTSDQVFVMYANCVQHTCCIKHHFFSNKVRERWVSTDSCAYPNTKAFLLPVRLASQTIFRYPCTLSRDGLCRRRISELREHTMSMTTTLNEHLLLINDYHSIIDFRYCLYR